MRVCPGLGARGGRTYVPSGLRDSGMTRSSVRGSTAMPESVVLGIMSGFDMVFATASRARGGGGGQEETSGWDERQVNEDEARDAGAGCEKMFKRR